MSLTWTKKNPRKKPQPRKRKWLQIIFKTNQQKNPQKPKRQQSKPNQFQKRM